MAKKLTGAEAKVKKVTERDKIQTAVGNFIANREGVEIDRLREGILISTSDGDVVIKVIAKKEEIQYTEDDVLETYVPDTAEGDE